MRLAGIYTIRNTPQAYFWDIVFEWEDEFSKTLNIPLVPVGERYDTIYQPGNLAKVLNRLNYFQLRDKYFKRPEKYFLAFHIGPPGLYSFYCARNVIPVIIDFWKHENLARFEKIFALCPVVFVTSKEVFNYLKEKKVKVNLQHVSLSLPDKYVGESASMEKPIDVIQLGRQNKQLKLYMDEFLVRNPDVHYVYAESIGGELNMISSRNGNLGKFKTRDAFISLLKQAKVSLLSAPGMDEDDKRTGGFSPVTPRFFESAVCGCKMVGVYPQNDDFGFNKIRSVCPNVTSFDEFNRIVSSYLLSDTAIDYTDFITVNLSSNKAIELNLKLNPR
jgi:hypothetical protein